MAIVYLQPTDLSPAQAQQVLDFLNRASSAEQLARDIEFPHELDIGVKLGQRLLDARTALGGSFTAVAQVRAVRLIGPERFTEICVAALGFQPDRWVELFYGANPMSTPTETGLAVTLQPRPQPAWLGQPLRLTVRVADLGGTPRGGVAVTVQTGAGKLSWMYGFQHVEGQAVTVLTGTDGEAELELIREPSEPLSELHQAALENALAELDVNASDPLKLQAEFRALAQLYLLERNYNLRRAIDIHVRDHREAMLGAINPGAWRLSWPVESVLLQADAHASSGGGTAVARAVVAVQWKNWVGAWLEFFGDVLKEASGLDAKFQAAIRRGADAEVITDLLGQAQNFVADQAGRSAQWLGQKTIDAAVAKVVSSDLENLPAEARSALLTQLEVASREVSPTTLGNFTLVTTIRKKLGANIAGIDALSLERLNRAEALLGEVDARAAQVDARAARVEELAAQVQRADVQVGEQLGRINAGVARMDAQLAAFDQQRGDIGLRLDGLQTNFTRLQVDFGRLQTPRAAPPRQAAPAPAPRARKAAPPLAPEKPPAVAKRTKAAKTATAAKAAPPAKAKRSAKTAAPKAKGAKR